MMSPEEIRKRLEKASSLGQQQPRWKGALGDPEAIRQRLLRVAVLRELSLKLQQARSESQEQEA